VGPQGGPHDVHDLLHHADVRVRVPAPVAMVAVVTAVRSGPGERLLRQHEFAVGGEPRDTADGPGGDAAGVGRCPVVDPVVDPPVEESRAWPGTRFSSIVAAPSHGGLIS
jgi:hypothetical protein